MIAAMLITFLVVAVLTGLAAIAAVFRTGQMERRLEMTRSTGQVTVPHGAAAREPHTAEPDSAVTYQEALESREVWVSDSI